MHGHTGAWNSQVPVGHKSNVHRGGRTKKEVKEERRSRRGAVKVHPSTQRRWSSVLRELRGNTHTKNGEGTITRRHSLARPTFARKVTTLSPVNTAYAWMQSWAVPGRFVDALWKYAVRRCNVYESSWVLNPMPLPILPFQTATSKASYGPPGYSLRSCCPIVRGGKAPQGTRDQLLSSSFRGAAAVIPMGNKVNEQLSTRQREIA